MCTQHDTGTRILLGEVTSQAFVDELNEALATVLACKPDPAPDEPFRYMPSDFKIHKSDDNDFEVSKVLARITGAKPEEAFLYVEIITKGHELTPI